MLQEYSKTLYKPTHEVKWLEKYLSTTYRISNGDFDLGPYVFEIELVEHRLNETHSRLGHDEVQYREAIQLDKARRKRLQEDRDKDEFTKLAELRRCFLAEFKMTKVQYDREVISFRGKDLLNFYFKMEDKFGKRTVRLKLKST